MPKKKPKGGASAKSTDEVDVYLYWPSGMGEDNDDTTMCTEVSEEDVVEMPPDERKMVRAVSYKEYDNLLGLYVAWRNEAERIFAQGRRVKLGLVPETNMQLGLVTEAADKEAPK